eukprot:9499849-Pyramimonas_sp.AAC.1
MLRGVSGGQRKRVTVGEMLMGNRRVLLMDEISKGLDAATILEIVRHVRMACEALRFGVVMSLLQPAPEVAATFHDVMLLAEGQARGEGS